MDDALAERVREAAEAHALFNALEHGGEAQVGAVMGPLMGAHPEFREHGDAVPGLVAPVVEAVNDLDDDEKRDRLEALAPELAAELDAEPEPDERTLPPLPNADGVDEVRMRLAPNPNGPWHLGHARMPAVIGTYKARYDGWFCCRFDDTDPETKRPDLAAYDQILDDIDYLGFEPDRVVRASDRLETYYEHGRALVEAGGAYTCSCPAEEFSTMKNAAEACPHREKPPDQSAEEFEAMVEGAYDAGEKVLRVRTDIEHPNPALRDWVAFRVVDTPHPRPEAADYRCWPMLDFQSGIDDHLLGITHVIRGIDLQDSAKRQRFVYGYFGWDYPEVVHWGHVQVDEYDVRLSTSRIRELVEAGELDGWDDPRAPTLMSVRRRGICGAAVTAAMIELGTSTSNVDLAMASVYAKNRALVDDAADRLFFVRDGVELPLVGGPGTGEPPVHPDHPDRGRRELAVGGAVRLEADDVPPNGERVWLKGLGCVRHVRDALEHVDDDIEVVREGNVPVVHWVPAEGSRPATLRTPDGDVDGRAEAGISAYDPDDVVQFERVGFARIDEHVDGHTVAYYAHP
jgi:glutamyl-tRNA synthetase